MEGRKIIARVLTVLGILIVVGYSYFVLDDFIRGPRIILEAPLSGLATTTTHIVIAGRAIHVNSLSLNGAPVPYDLQGNFSESLLLAEGYNIMKITAIDRYNRTVEKTIEMNLLKVSTSTETTIATTTQPIINM